MTGEPLDLDAATDAFDTLLQQTPCACPDGDDHGPTSEPCVAAEKAHTAGYALIAEAKRLREENAQIARTASEVYCAITGGLLSYPTYDTRTILSAAGDETQKFIDEETAGLRSENDGLRAQVAAVEQLCDEAEARVGVIRPLDIRAALAATGGTDDK